jgi:CheY-like chemotaxis protein
VLTDLLMPGMRGDSAVKVIRTQRPAIRAIFISGYVDPDVAADPESVLYKPFELPELGRRLRSALDAGSANTAHRIDPAAD